jgi:CheY-like chemotaxis protein
MSAEILIVDDEPDICELVSGILQDEGYATRTARDGDGALAAIKTRRPNLLFLDIWLQGSKLDGLQLLDAAKDQYPDLPVVMISGHGNIETAVAAIKRGGSRAGKFQAQARGQGAEGDFAAAIGADRQIAGHEPVARDDREGRTHQQPHHDHRHLRLRQGIVRAHDP